MFAEHQGDRGAGGTGGAGTKQSKVEGAETGHVARSQLREDLTSLLKDFGFDPVLSVGPGRETEATPVISTELI